jgi:Mitochondrial domain of unknown function (DUF1713)
MDVSLAQSGQRAQDRCWETQSHGHLDGDAVSIRRNEVDAVRAQLLAMFDAETQQANPTGQRGGPRRRTTSARTGEQAPMQDVQQGIRQHTPCQHRDGLVSAAIDKRHAPPQVCRHGTDAQSLQSEVAQGGKVKWHTDSVKRKRRAKMKKHKWKKRRKLLRRKSKVSQGGSK